jgi:hypothetical protein
MRSSQDKSPSTAKNAANWFQYKHATDLRKVAFKGDGDEASNVTHNVDAKDGFG